jgi:hypothetical protein
LLWGCCLHCWYQGSDAPELVYTDLVSLAVKFGFGRQQQQMSFS